MLFAMLFTAIATTPSFAQQEKSTADKILAVVGKSRIILQSELEGEVLRMQQEDPASFHDTMRCALLQQMILRKLLVEQAERDSVIVSDEEVEGTLENRVRYFISMYGSKENLEKISGKTIYQMKEDYREAIREGMVAERMQGNILQHVKVTPAEVQAFFKKIPVDSLPFFPAMVEMGQIVIDPEVNPELEAYARKKLEDIRNDIVKNGKSFETQATFYSEDPGSRDNGGDLGVIGRKDVVSEFAAAAFKLQNGEISPIVKTKFGYHIIQMVRRQGEQAHLRHILIKPQYTSADYQKALDKLDTVRSLLIAGKTTFQEAVGKYATDEMSTRTGGMIADMQTGSTLLEVDKLDPDLALMVDYMKPGMFSKPQLFTRGPNDKSARIVYMKSKIDPHKANLTDDYSRIQDAALQQKKSQKMDSWLAEKAPTYYVKIAEEYKTCPSLQVWTNAPGTAGK